MNPSSNPKGAEKPLRIMIVDDHEVMRRGLRAVIEGEPGWTVCAEAAGGREALALAKKENPDVVILDISMPGLNGLEAARRLRATVPRSELLVLTMHDSDVLLRQAVESGVRGFVLKSDAGRELVAAIHALRDDKPFFSSSVAGRLASGYLRNGQSDASPQSRLTARETEIVQLLAEGKSNKEVAVALDITVKTAETHRTNILRKLELHSLADLVRYAVRNKIIEP
jgi:DNA-binding NarL/FixJ family response regulator